MKLHCDNDNLNSVPRMKMELKAYSAPMRSYKVLKLHNFHLAIREKFSLFLKVIILISRPIFDKFNKVREKTYGYFGNYALSSIQNKS